MRRLSLLLTLPLLSLSVACFDDKDEDEDDGDDTGSSSDDGGDSYDDPYAKDYAGGYNVNTCGETLPEPTSPSGDNNDYADMWAEGDIIPNYTFIDQNGEEVELYSFCGNHVMIAFGAMWCGPCQQLASEAQDIQDEYGEQGFQMIEVLIANASDNAPADRPAGLGERLRHEHRARPRRFRLPMAVPYMELRHSTIVTSAPEWRS